MKIFVISRRQDVTRRASLLQDLEQRNLPYELVYAVDGRELDDAAKRRMADYPKMRRVLRVLSDGEIGCAASHNAVYRKMVESGIDEACILEDDAKIVGTIPDGLGRTDAAAVLLTAPRRERIWTVGYLINRAGARAMLGYNEPIWRVADCWESVARRGLVDVSWHAQAAVEPNAAIGSVITPQGVPPHQVPLPGDPWSRVKRAFWRMAYGVGMKI